MRWSRLPGSSLALAIARAAINHEGPVVAITPDTASANRLEAEIGRDTQRFLEGKVVERLSAHPELHDAPPSAVLKAAASIGSPGLRPVVLHAARASAKTGGGAVGSAAVSSEISKPAAARTAPQSTAVAERDALTSSPELLP